MGDIEPIDFRDVKPQSFSDRVVYYADNWFKDIQYYRKLFAENGRASICSFLLGNLTTAMELDTNSKGDIQSIFYRGISTEAVMPRRFADGVEKDNMLFLEVLTNAYVVMNQRNSRTPKFDLDEYKFLTEYIIAGIEQKKQYDNFVSAVADSMNVLGSLTNINNKVHLAINTRNVKELIEAEKMMTVLCTLHGMTATALADPSSEYHEFARGYYGKLTDIFPAYMDGDMDIHKPFAAGLVNIGRDNRDGSNMIDYINRVRDIALINSDELMLHAVNCWVSVIKENIKTHIFDYEGFYRLGIQIEEDLSVDLDTSIREKLNSLSNKNIREFEMKGDFLGTFSEEMIGTHIEIDSHRGKAKVTLKFKRDGEQYKSYSVFVPVRRDYRELVLNLDINSSPEVLIIPEILDGEVMEVAQANPYKRLIANILDMKIDELIRLRPEKQKSKPIGVAVHPQKVGGGVQVAPIPESLIINHINIEGIDLSSTPEEVLRKIERINNFNAGSIGFVRIRGEDVHYIRAGGYLVTLNKISDKYFTVREIK